MKDQHVDIASELHLLESAIGHPSEGLPTDLFLFVSRITPLVNVDLLVKNEQRQTLLTWREDEYYGPGWHVPGGIVRFKETMADRINAVAAGELGARVNFRRPPLAVNEVIHPTRSNRAHFISFLFECTLASPLDATLAYTGGDHKAGEWAWHEGCPSNIIAQHEMYRQFMHGEESALNWVRPPKGA